MLNSVRALIATLLILVLTPAVTSQQASWAPLGAGCPGSVGVPVLTPMQNSLPFVGETFWSELSNLPINGIGVGLSGLSNTSWIGLSLPVGLGDLLAMPGCLLYTDVRQTRTLLISGGRVSWPLALPDMPSLHGVNFFQQAFIVDPGAPNLLGAVMSNASSSVIENFSGNLTVRVLGGATGDIPQVGVRVLRHDLGTGAVLDDQVTGVGGIVDFGVIRTSRTTISVVAPPPLPFAEGFIRTLMNVRVGNLTVLGGPEPGVLASFNVDLVGVPPSTDEAFVLIGGPDFGHGSDAAVLTPPTASFFDVEVRWLQSDGNISILTQAGIDGVGVTTCGMLLDVDPATIVLGSTLIIPTITPPTDVPFIANEPVFTDGSLMRRSGLIFEDEFFTDADTSGDFSVCDVPGADKYSFIFLAADLRGAATLLSFDAIPASMNVNMHNMAFSGFDRDVDARRVSWVMSGSDTSGLDAGEVYFEWQDPMSGSYLEWGIQCAGDATSVVLPQLPGDLSIFEPPEFASVEVEVFDFDNVTGYDDYMTSISAMGGNLVLLAMTGSELRILFGPLE